MKSEYLMAVVRNCRKLQTDASGSQIKSTKSIQKVYKSDPDIVRVRTVRVYVGQITKCGKR